MTGPLALDTSGFPPCGDDLGGGSCRFALSGCAQKHAVFSDPNKAFGSSSGNLRRFGASSHLGVLRALRDQKMFTSTVRRCLVGNYRTKSPEGIFIACRCLGSAVAGVPIKEPQQLVRVKKNNKLQQQ